MSHLVAAWAAHPATAQTATAQTARRARPGLLPPRWRS